jgi:allantoin racemase
VARTANRGNAFCQEVSMKIKVINPNTTETMTAKIGAAARDVAAPGTEIIAVSPEMGPVSIEGHYDEAISVLGVLEEVRRGEAAGCDGYVIACFGDPGLLAAREVARGPVVGIAEAAMHAASLISSGFSVVTTLPRSRVLLEQLVAAYGMGSKCRSVRPTELAVLDLERKGSNARRAIIGECRRAIAEDHADCLLLGCAGMADLVAEVREAVGVPVIDGVAAGVKLIEALVGLGLATSKAGGYAYPLQKPYLGSMRAFAPAEAR